MTDLLSLVGWSSYDMRMPGDALRYLGQSVAVAAEIEDTVRLAITIDQIARVYLRLGAPDQVLKSLQLGTLTAERAEHGQLLALIAATTARTYAEMGKSGLALDALTCAREALETTPSAPLPEPHGFDAAMLQSNAGQVFVSLASSDVKYASQAIDLLSTYTATVDNVHVKRGVISALQLACAYFRAGEPAEAIAIGHDAIERAASIRSNRVADHLGLLRAEAVRHARNKDAADLAHSLNAAIQSSLPLV